MSDKRITELSSIVWDDLADDDQFTVVDVSDTTMDPTGTNKRVPKSQMQAGIDAAVAAHTGDASAAHAASAISYNGAAGLSATDVEAALDELDTEKASTGSVTTVSDGLAAHIADAADAHDASAISVLDTAGNFTGTDVEAVLAELPGRYVSPALAAVLPRVWQDFAPQGAGVRLSRSGTTYTMWQHLGAQVWVRTRLATEAGLSGGGNLVHRVTGDALTTPGVDIVAPVLYVEDTVTAQIAYTGTGWGSVSNGSASGGSYQRPTTSGAKATWTTPDATTRVGVHYVAATNNGIAKVTIDGSTTAANLLPTAQQLVDAGAPNTILVANGGPFAPTDRVLDMYRSATAYGAKAWLADDLAPGVHTVVIEMTAAKQSAASDSRITIDAFWYATQATTPDTASAVMVPLAEMTYIATTDEYAILSGATWFGGSHGYEVETGLTFTVDGTSAAPADGATTTGLTAVVATRTTNLFHPDFASGASPIATTSLTYTVDSAGLHVQGSINWLGTLSISRAYLGMLTANGSMLKKYTGSNLASPVTLTTNDGAYYGASRSLSAWLWDAGDVSTGPGRAASLVHLSAATLNNWQHSDGAAATPRLMCVEDRTSGTGLAHKVYPTRVGPSSGASVANGDTWTVDYYHRHQWFPAAIANARMTA